MIARPASAALSACEPGHAATLAGNGLRDVRLIGGEDFTQFFRIETGGQRRGADDVTEQHRNL
ncbi:MAG: hypothetical protein ACJ8AW_52200, partial [Rhodopila sp.]